MFAGLTTVLIFSLGLLACNDNQNSKEGTFQIGNKCETSECFSEALQRSKQEIQNLSQGCNTSSDCSLVALDFLCNKSYTSILESELKTYTTIIENFHKLFDDESEGGWACSMEWSPTYDPNNYESQCVESKCEAIYLGDPSMEI